MPTTFPSSAIKSIQAGTITFGAADTTKTATITSVSTSKSLVLHGGHRPALNDITAGLATLTLTNATTVTADRNSTGSSGLVVAYTVLEFL